MFENQIENTTISYKNMFKWFLLIFIPVVLIWFFSLFNNSTAEYNFKMNKVLDETIIDDTYKSKLAVKDINENIENLKIIRDANEVVNFLDNPTLQNKEQTIKFFTQILENKIYFEQVRYIDSSGSEIIRVQKAKSSDKIAIVPDEQLQNKSKRYYFKDTMKLNFNEIYISPLDLNMEFGVVEKPYIPTLRIATPVFNSKNKLLGVIVVNYNASHFLTLLSYHKEYKNVERSEFYILNENGQFIIHPDKSLYFSFMRKDTANLSLKEENSVIWNKMINDNFNSSFLGDNLLYIYTDVFNGIKNKDVFSDQKIILLHVVNIENLKPIHLVFSNLSKKVSLITLFFILIFSSLLAYAIERLIDRENELEMLMKLAELSDEAIVITNPDTTITYINKAYEKTTGFLKEEVLGLKTNDFKSGIHDKSFYQKMWTKLSHKGYWEGIVWDKKKNGLLCAKKLKIIQIKDKKTDQVSKYIGFFSDISMYANRFSIQTANNPKKQSVTIPNEEIMIDLLKSSVNRSDVQFYVIYLTIENYNIVNSTINKDNDHISGAITKMISPFLKDNDFIAQTGRDLFSIVINKKEMTDENMDFLKELHRKMSAVVTIYGKDLFFKIRMGMSIWPQDANDIKTLLLNSMVALEWTRRGQNAEVAIFDKSMFVELSRENEIESRLRNAIKNEELSLVYQPQIDISSEKVAGMEALLRWNNSFLGNVSPAIFVPIAEKSLLMIEIGNWIINQACKDIKTISQSYNENFRCAINLSSVQMSDANLKDYFFSCIADNEIQPEQVELELTETSLLNDTNKNIAILNEIRAAGVHIAIDDFGTGYSSLAYLKLLPLDKIKVDRGFIKDYPEQDNGTLAKILVNMSKTLGIKVLTEGAETKEQVDYLKALGCNYVQGYYYSKPLPLPELLAFLNKNKEL